MSRLWGNEVKKYMIMPCGKRTQIGLKAETGQWNGKTVYHALCEAAVSWLECRKGAMEWKTTLSCPARSSSEFGRAAVRGKEEVKQLRMPQVNN